MSKILLTGSSGFIGQALARRLLAEGHRLRLPVRSSLPWQSEEAVVFPFDGLEAPTDWAGALVGVDVVIHCAGRQRAKNMNANGTLGEYRRCNVDGSVRLASQAARAGVGRFVFVSTAEVCGEQTQPGQPFSVESVPAPVSPYAISKLEAERALFALTASSNMEVVIVRPPPVYGPGVKGDFHALMQWIDQGKPLPLAGVESPRSMVSRSNLVDFLAQCVYHPAAAGHILYVRDGNDLTVFTLVSKFGEALGKPPQLTHMSAWRSRLYTRLFRRYALIERLKIPMQVDIEHTRRLLNWVPPYEIDDSLAQTAAYFRKHPQN
ncbi:MAG: NAD-dependent epimerase/dehydratase family protein [Betaproteobacteria bacterium]|nr:NAD-dependent epimerase/dehydratase family protein [Betaproteobacteria bacterium]